MDLRRLLPLRNADKTIMPDTKQPGTFGAAGLFVRALSLFIIAVLVAREDYWSRVCLFSRDDVFQ